MATSPNFSVRLSDELRNYCAKRAEELGISVSAYIKFLIITDKQNAMKENKNG